MTPLVKRLHVYLGLLSFTQFVVYGIAGLTATAQTSRERPKKIVSTRYLSFHADHVSTDRQVADAVYRTLNLAFTRPMPDWFLKRTPDHHLQLDFYQINGISRVTVLEQEGRLRIDEIRNSPWLFLEDIHAIAAARTEDGPHFRLLRWWGWYNEFALWTLIAMSLSGFYLWLASRPRLGWAQLSASCGLAIFAVCYFVLR